MNLNGYPSSLARLNGMCGIITCLLECCPVVISAMITCLMNCWQTILLTLHRPFGGSRFLKSIIRQFIFNDNRWGRTPFGNNVLRKLYSIVIILCHLLLHRNWGTLWFHLGKDQPYFHLSDQHFICSGKNGYLCYIFWWFCIIC